MWDDNFKNNSTLARHIVENISTDNDISNVIDYINNMSVSQMDEYNDDIKRLKKVKSYIESILK
jgi:hypothetical protein